MEDFYTTWNNLREKIKNMSAEERIRWELNNDCTCGFLPTGEWNIPEGHYSGCPMKNPNAEMWILYESIEEGFIIPKSGE